MQHAHAAAASCRRGVCPGWEGSAAAVPAGLGVRAGPVAMVVCSRNVQKCWKLSTITHCRLHSEQTGPQRVFDPPHTPPTPPASRFLFCPFLLFSVVCTLLLFPLTSSTRLPLFLPSVPVFCPRLEAIPLLTEEEKRFITNLNNSASRFSSSWGGGWGVIFLFQAFVSVFFTG